MRYILIILWLLTGVGYCSIANICGSESAGGTITPVAAKETPCPSIDSYHFNWSSSEVITNEKWLNYKSTLLDKMKETSKVRITGLYNNKEANTSSFENLGLARANALAKLIGLEEEMYQLAHDSMRNVKYKIDCNLPAAKIKLVTVSEKIKEIDDRTLIYFPVNSVNKLADAEVESYLDDLAERINQTGEKVKLDGHTDNSGTEDYNMELGEKRALIIKDYLLSRKVKQEQILTESFGDKLPIQSNDSEEGKAANRRVELKIINE